MRGTLGMMPVDGLCWLTEMDEQVTGRGASGSGHRSRPVPVQIKVAGVDVSEVGPVWLTW